MSSPTRHHFYPAVHYERWASDFWAIFQALQEDSVDRHIQQEDLSDDALATVAALLIVANKVDDLLDK